MTPLEPVRIINHGRVYKPKCSTHHIECLLGTTPEELHAYRKDNHPKGFYSSGVALADWES